MLSSGDIPCQTKMKDFVCRFAQHWEDFRLAELDAVANIQNVSISYNREEYSDEVSINVNNESLNTHWPF